MCVSFCLSVCLFVRLSAGRSSDGSAPGTPGTPATMATATSISASNVQLSDGGVGRLVPLYSVNTAEYYFL